MTRYKVRMIYPDGTSDVEDEVFDSESDAQEYGCYLCSCYDLGGEILNMSNPGDYPLSDATTRQTLRSLRFSSGLQLLLKKGV